MLAEHACDQCVALSTIISLLKTHYSGKYLGVQLSLNRWSVAGTISFILR